MLESDVITVNTKTVACDGGHWMGHPTIYLSVDIGAVVKCPYCSQRFSYKKEKQYLTKGV